MQGVLPVGRFPTRDYEEITVTLGKVGRLSLLIIVCLENQGNDSRNDHAELKQFFPCNHNRHPLSHWMGAKKSYYPRRKSRGTAYRGTTDSTFDSVPQELANCKEKTGNTTASCPIPMKIHQKGEEKSSPFSFSLAIRRQLCYTEFRITNHKTWKG